MIYKQVSSKIVIANLFDSYNIKETSFISRVPNWIYRAMRELNIHMSFLNQTLSGTVADYKCILPAETQVLRAVSYQGKRLPRIGGKLNERVDSDMPTLYHSSYKYELSNNSYIVTNFEEGAIKFYIKSLSTTLDTETQLRFPNIPDNEKLFIGLEYYIITKLLLRGFKVGEFSLKVADRFLNPRFAWIDAKKGIRNSLNAMDEDEMEVYKRQRTTFIQNYDYFYEEAFNGTYID